MKKIISGWGRIPSDKHFFSKNLKELKKKLKIVLLEVSVGPTVIFNTNKQNEITTN